jgi:hypothetical protein
MYLEGEMVGTIGFEPTTSSVSKWHDEQDQQLTTGSGTAKNL